MARPIIIDGRNLLDPAVARDAGFTYKASAGRVTRRPRAGAAALMEALLLAGGKASGSETRHRGFPKPARACRRLPARGVHRCALVGRRRHAGDRRVSRRPGEAFVNALGGIGAEIERSASTSPLGRGGGFGSLRRAVRGGLRARAERRRATRRRLRGAARGARETPAAGATIVVAQVRSPFGVVDFRRTARHGFREAPLLATG